jgi:hypothetical protein
MRYLVLGACVFAAACAGEGSGVPTSPSSTVVMPALTEAKGGTALPFKGTLQGTETIDGTHHTIAGSGQATQLGRFTSETDITVIAGAGVGTAVWTAANGDQLFISFAGQGVLTFPIVTITETEKITGGTGRFVGASGTFETERSVNLATGATSGSFTGKINLSH